MAKIFISYRREDTESVANHLKSELEKYVGKGKVFLDSKGIQPGRDWRDVLQRSVKGSDCLLALIGPKWLNIGDSETKQRRLGTQCDRRTSAALRGYLNNSRHRACCSSGRAAGNSILFESISAAASTCTKSCIR
jgi:hypothetical protein